MIHSSRFLPIKVPYGRRRGPGNSNGYLSSSGPRTTGTLLCIPGTWYYRLEPTKIEGTVCIPGPSPPSAQEYITRQSSSKSISLRMTGKMTGKCRTAGNSAKSFQLPASGPGIPYIYRALDLGRFQSLERAERNNSGTDQSHQCNFRELATRKPCCELPLEEYLQLSGLVLASA